jgi:hypothetical protein
MTFAQKLADLMKEKDGGENQNGKKRLVRVRQADQTLPG